MTAWGPTVSHGLSRFQENACISPDPRHVPLTPGTWDLTPDTRDRRPVATGTPVDPVVRMSHCLSRPQYFRVSIRTKRHYDRYRDAWNPYGPVC